MDNKLKIINYLGKHMEESFTIRQMSCLIKIPYASFYRTLDKMKDLINIKIIGKSKVISLNKENPCIKSYLSVSSEEEKKEFLKKQPIISKISSEINSKDIVILFGSYAKGSEKNTSDIDMLIINKKGDISISFLKYDVLFNKKINPIFLMELEFKKMLKEKNENVGRQALKNHIILNNPENFWSLVV